MVGAGAQPDDQEPAQLADVGTPAAEPLKSSSPQHRAVPAELCHVQSLVSRIAHTPDANKLVFVMVGLPARGKSFISLRLARFLEWNGTETRVFNVGNHRRKTEVCVQDASYFDPAAKDAASRREAIALEVLTEMLGWLAGPADRIAIFDATNTTRARRAKVAERLSSLPGIGVIFVESVCNDTAILEANLAVKLSHSPDYSASKLEEAKQDLFRRIQNYEKVYESIDEDVMNIGGQDMEVSYIKIFNLSSHVIAHNIWGRAATTVLPFLMAIHVGSRPIWLVRLPHAAVTPYSWRRQGNPWPPPKDVQFSEQPLSCEGAAFADAFAAFVEGAVGQNSVAIYTGTHRRGLELAGRLRGRVRTRTSLNPQDRGACNGLGAGQMADQAPEALADPLHRRFLGGECLGDMLQRLVPTLIEIEQDMQPVVVTAPLSALQVFLCHYRGIPVAQALSLELPLHSVLELRPDGGHFFERRFCMSQGALVAAAKRGPESGAEAA